MAKVVITAPLWGRVSNPPEESEAILWRISGEIFIAWLICKYVGARASKDIPSPPEAEAVSPHIKLTDKASEIIGFDETPNITNCIRVNTASDFITLPYPTIALEFNSGLNELVTPLSNTDFKFFIFLKLVIIKNKSAKTIAIITLQVPETLLKVVLNSLR